MRRNLLLLSLLVICFAAQSHAQGKVYRDTDWNTAFVDNCGLPKAKSVKRIRTDGDRKLQFTLARRDKGKCSTDNTARHRAPYWERAELSQKNRMRVGSRYRISAEVAFVEGFTGEREAFFQIHGWTPKCQKAYPPLMLKFNKGRMTIETLRGVSLLSGGRHRNVLNKNIEIGMLYGRAVELVVDFDTNARPGRVSVSLAGRQLVSNVPVEFARCARPYVKVGVYRPGGKGSGTSRVVFDDLQVERVK